MELHFPALQEAVSKHGVTKFIGSSGGNAGMAMAVAAKVQTHAYSFCPLNCSYIFSNHSFELTAKTRKDLFAYECKSFARG